MHRHLPRPFLLLLLLLVVDQSVSAARVFSATSKSARLRRRTISFEPRYDGNSIFYAEGAQDSKAISAIKISLNPKQPMLIHEDVYDHITSVRCAAEKIDISFSSEDVMLQAQRDWDSSTPFLFVTTDSSCAKSGEHGVYTVSYNPLDQNNRTVTLRANCSSLRGSSHDMYIDLGHHVVSELQHSMVPQLYQRRDSDPTPSATQQETSTSSFWIPPTTVETSVDAEQDLTFSKTNFTLLPPSLDIISSLPESSNNTLFKLNCADCSMMGTVGLSVAGFTLQDEDQDGENDSLFDTVNSFRDNGYFEFFVQNVSGHFGFDLIFEPGFTLSDDGILARLPDITMSSIQIPGIISFGPVIEMPITITATLTEQVKISAGFKFSVPDDSKAILNMTDMDSSFATGFGDAKLIPLPFDMDSKNLSGQITVAFQPGLFLKAEIGDQFKDVGNVEGKVGVNLDLPKLIANITTLENVNENCTGTAAAGFENDTYVSIDFSASIGMNALAKLEVTANIPSIPGTDKNLLDLDKEQSLLVSKPIALGQTCLLWEESSTHLVKAKAQIKPTPFPLLPTTISPGMLPTSSSSSSTSAEPTSGAFSTTVTPSLDQLCVYAAVLIASIYAGIS